jgi:hypothetical protein
MTHNDTIQPGAPVLYMAAPISRAQIAIAGTITPSYLPESPQATKNNELFFFQILE